MDRAWPGEIHSLEVGAESAPSLGVRVRLHPVRCRTTDVPEMLGFEPDPDGPWKVVAVRPSDDGSARVNVLTRKL